jgi:hypothetical protein
MLPTSATWVGDTCAPKTLRASTAALPDALIPIRGIKTDAAQGSKTRYPAPAVAIPESRFPNPRISGLRSANGDAVDQ